MIDKFIEPVSKILDKFVADKDLKQKLEHELLMSIQEANLAQIKVNQQEAAHKSIFVAGWRPFIGWTCGIALAWHFVLQPLIMFLSVLFGFTLPELPAFDMGSLMTVLMGMLGLGGLRTYEKQKGLTK